MNLDFLKNKDKILFYIFHLFLCAEFINSSYIQSENRQFHLYLKNFQKLISLKILNIILFFLFIFAHKITL